MRRALVTSLLLAAILSGCSGSSTVTPAPGPTASSTAIPSGSVKPVSLTDTEVATVRRDVAAAFNDPKRPLIDTIAGAADAAGNRFACGNVFGQGVSGLPYAGRFVSQRFQIIAKGGTTAETRAAEDVCRRLGILPRRIL